MFNPLSIFGHRKPDLAAMIAAASRDIIKAINQAKKEIMDQLDTDIAALQADVTNATTVTQSAVTLINGISAQIAAAVAAATAAGATPAQLDAIQAVQTSLEANTAALSAAVQANTTPAK